MSSDRLSRYSQRMAAVTLCFALGMLVLNAACWVFPQLTSAAGGHGFGFGLTNGLITSLGTDVTKFPWWQKAGAILLSSLPLLVLAHGLAHLRLLFRAYGRRQYFSRAASNHLGKLARAVWLWVLSDLICEPLLSVWLTLREPVGHRVITLSIGSPDIVALFLAASLAVIAHILREASEMDAEHRLFV